MAETEKLSFGRVPPTHLERYPILLVGSNIDEYKRVTKVINVTFSSDGEHCNVASLEKKSFRP